MHLYIEPKKAFLSCHVCGGLEFARREVKMNTTGLTFLELDWLNRSADGAICTRCGYVHLFMGDAHEWQEYVDPADLPVDPLV